MVEQMSDPQKNQWQAPGVVTVQLEPDQIFHPQGEKRHFQMKKNHLLWLRLMGTELKNVRQKSKAMTFMQKKATRKE